MAVVETIGRVQYLKILDGAGFVSVLREGPARPSTELLIIWWLDRSEGPAALFTTMLSMALARNLRVKLSHQHDSAYIFRVVVEAS